MKSDIVEQAARNNALWCDAVCETHNGAGEFHDDLWIDRFGPPPAYPDVVTLTRAGAAAQTRTISELVRAAPHRGWAVKDSFLCLDLRDDGFAPLFDAEWISAPAEASGARASTQKLQWGRVDDEPALLRWKRAWSQEPAATRTRVFMPRLLSNPDIHFVLVVAQGALVGGGVLNRGAGVVGVSNVFASASDLAFIWEALADRARSAFPGLPIVSYEHEKETLRAACRSGFAPVGRLRVWRTAAGAPS